MLNTHFATLESVLANLDSQISASQALATELETRALTAKSQREQRIASRNEALKTHLPAIFQSKVASDAEIVKLPESVRPLADETYSKVERLNQAKQFADLVSQIDVLTDQFKAANNLEKEAEIYNKLRPLISEIRETPFGSAQDALLSELQATTAASKSNALDNLEKSLGSDWPSTNPDSLEFVEALRISLLLDDNDFDGALETFNVLCNALDVRFKFNFESQQKTRRFDKPEWLFYFFGKMMDPHLEWLKSTVQPVVSEAFPDVLAVNAFASALLPSVFRAAKLYLENCKHDPEMLNHFLDESFKFDQNLVDKYYYYFSADWLGLTTTCLVNDDDGFKQWLRYEIEAANNSFTDLSQNEQAWNIDYDSADTKTTSRVTFLGLGFSTLFDSITEFYKNLRMPRLQLLFLNDIQLALIDRYVSFLKRRKNDPRADLDDYGKVLGSLGYFIDFLQHRNSYLIFIDLQQSIGAEGGLFDEVIQSLETFRDTCLDEITNMLKGALPQLFKAYIHKRDAEDSTHLLHAPCSKITHRLDFFKNICNVVDFAGIKLKFTASLASFFLKSVIQASTFTPQEGTNLKQDLEFLWSTLSLVKTQEYLSLIAAAEYFETGSRPDSLPNDLYSAIQRRRA